LCKKNTTDSHACALEAASAYRLLACDADFLSNLPNDSLMQTLARKGRLATWLLGRSDASCFGNSFRVVSGIGTWGIKKEAAVSRILQTS
jgi:hypothetical protein